MPAAPIKGLIKHGCREPRLSIQRILFALLTTAAISAAAPAHAQQPRAVVELFTSQGCSSCPPADKLLGELSQDSSVIALSVPVDYWDYLGWKDTLATPGNSKRQRAYAQSRGDREVFTPQAVVNGTVYALGSDRAAIEGAIAKSASANTSLNVPVKLAVASGKISVDLPAKDGAAGEVWLCPLSKQVPVAIGRGENNGKNITYYNVIRRWVKLGDWSGKAASFSLPVSQVAADDIDAVAVMVQSGDQASPGKMLGASTAGLR